MSWSLDAQPLPPERRKIFENGIAPDPPEIKKYKVVKTLGAGGMGIVYLVKDRLIPRDAALKVINPDKVTSETLARFQSEVASLGKIKHPSIATIYEAGFYQSSSGDDLPYFAMELVKDPISITEYVEKCQLSMNARMSIILKIADAISAAHDINVPHLDISAKNVLASMSNDHPDQTEVLPRVVDFGLALDLSKEKELPKWANIRYAAPERFADEQADSFRCDVFSLGVLAYELLASQSPFQNPPPLGTKTNFGAEARGEITPLKDIRRSIPSKVLAVITRALKLSPSERYKNAREFKNDFERALVRDLLDESTEKRTPARRLAAFCSINRGPVLAAAVIFVTLIFGIAVSTWQAVEAAKARDIADKNRLAERNARERADQLRKSTDDAMRFLEEVVFAADSYNVGDQSLNLDFLFKQAEAKLIILQSDPRAHAIVLGSLGRVASNWGRFPIAVKWLQESASIWRQLEEKGGVVDDEITRKRALAAVLNHLSWATVGDLEASNGLSIRAKEASIAAKEAHDLLATTLGPTNEDSLAALADWIRFKQLSGDPTFVAEWVRFFALVMGTNEKDLVAHVAQTIHETSALIVKGDKVGAKETLRIFLRPLLSEQRPRLRARVPWGLAQAGSELKKVGPWLPFVGNLFPDFQVLGQVNAAEITRVQPVVMEVADDLGREILEQGHPDRTKIHELCIKDKLYATP
jgi:hypothetical protein